MVSRQEKSRQELWYLQMLAACYFAAESFKRGAYYDDDDTLSESDLTNDRLFREKSAYRSNVIGTVFTSFAFLDASINEVFLDAKFSTEIQRCQVIPFGTVESLRPNIIKAMAQIWTLRIKPKHWSTFEKYSKALTLNNQKKISENDPIGEVLDTLRKFRNCLTHPIPEWVTIQPSNKEPSPEKNDTLESRVKALIKSDKKRLPEGYHHEIHLVDPQFPVNCLNATLAKMAVKSCLEFDNEFCHRMGIEDKETRRPLKEALLSLDR